MPEPIEVGGVEVRPGKRAAIEIPVSLSYGHAAIHLPAYVIHGREPGPRLFLSAAIHGDEIVGVAVIRRLLQRRELRKLRGTLIAVPVVNVFGLMTQSRYLPDRRDLNRSFPGSATGSLAARLAHLFMEEIVARSTHGIDLHTGALHRMNLPQIRACIDDPETEALARAFGAPVIINSNLRDGSLRQAVFEKGVPMLLYEAGEALRFDELAIRTGIRGVLSVMRSIEMLPGKPRPASQPFIARSSTWVRAPQGGILRSLVRPGVRVEKRECLGTISGPLGEDEVEVPSPVSGIVIGATQLPLVNEGDALFNVATFASADSVADQVEALQSQIAPPVTPPVE